MTISFSVLSCPPFLQQNNPSVGNIELYSPNSDLIPGLVSTNTKSFWSPPLMTLVHVASLPFTTRSIFFHAQIHLLASSPWTCGPTPLRSSTLWLEPGPLFSFTFSSREQQQQEHNKTNINLILIYLIAIKLVTTGMHWQCHQNIFLIINYTKQYLTRSIAPILSPSLQ